MLSPVLLLATPYIVHEILQARILDWVVIPFSRGFSQLRDQTQVNSYAEAQMGNAHNTLLNESKSLLRRTTWMHLRDLTETKNAGAQRGKGLEQSHPVGKRDKEHEHPGASLATSLHPRGQGA